jgi:hypothetical protein
MKMGKMSGMMMVGCGLMLVAVILLPVLGVKLGGVLPFLFVLACPLSHVLMMAFMGKGHDHSGHGIDEESKQNHSRLMGAVASPFSLPAPGTRK